jgi:hypothetical protein
MTRLATTPAILGILVGGMLAAGLAAGCGSNQVTIGSQNIDAAAGRGGAVAGGSGGSATGGAVGSGGVAPTGGTVGVGGATPSGGITGVGAGGSKASGGTIASGGSKAGGGTIATGGTNPSGGTGGTGTGCASGWTLCCGQCLGPTMGVCMTPCPATGGAGATGGTPSTGGSTGVGGTKGTGGVTGTGGTGGSTGKTCGGIAGATCATNEFCDLQAGSCNVSDATGTCVLNVGVGCIASVQPVCGCNGKTYNNDCERQVAGVSKKSNGACPTGDAGATTCGQVTTQAECDGRSDCHSVFMDTASCDCSTLGCCQHFSRCADGGRANCKPPATFGCTISQPACGTGNYVISYTSNCYEGCVLTSECAVAADAGVIMTPTLPAACQVDEDCCVAMDTCMARAYLVGLTEYPAMVASIPSAASRGGMCLSCIQPAVQVQCKGGFCAGEKLPFSSSISSLMSSHCGYISVADAGTSTASAHAAVDAGTAAGPSTWSCSSH